MRVFTSLWLRVLDLCSFFSPIKFPTTIPSAMRGASASRLARASPGRVEPIIAASSSSSTPAECSASRVFAESKVGAFRGDALLPSS